MIRVWSILLLMNFAYGGIVLGAACCTVACAACNVCGGFLGAGFAVSCVPTCVMANPVLMPCVCGLAWPNICLVAELAPTI